MKGARLRAQGDKRLEVGGALRLRLEAFCQLSVVRGTLLKKQSEKLDFEFTLCSMPYALC